MTNKYGVTKKHLGTKKTYSVEEWEDVFLNYLEDQGKKVFNKKELIKGGFIAGSVIDVPADLPLSIESFCIFACISRLTFRNYESRPGYEDYFAVTTRMREIIEAEQLDKATVGAYDKSIIAYRLGFMKKDGGLVENSAENLDKYTTKAANANPLFLYNINSTSRIRVNRGGTRSGKTYSLVQIAVDWLLTGKIGDLSIPEGAFDVIRKTLPALRASVLKDILQVIKKRGLTRIIKHHKTNKTFSIKGIDREINYFSVDDEHKVRGSKRKIFWVNEADGITFDDFRQLNMRGVELCFLDFNPSKFDTWIKKQIEQKRYQEKGDVSIITSTYEDNLFLTSEEVAEIEYLRSGNADFWKVFGQGEYAKLAGIVFPEWDLWDGEDFDWTVKNIKVVTVGGIDFGMTSPSAIVKVHIDLANKVIYLEEIAYATHLGTAEIGSFIAKNLSECPVSCDSAEPRTIGELRKMGYGNVLKCPKKQVVSDIRRINGYKLVVREGSDNLIREFNNYHRPSENGEIISETPVPINDHAMDAMRYGIIYGLNISKAK